MEIYHGETGFFKDRLFDYMLYVWFFRKYAVLRGRKNSVDA